MPLRIIGSRVRIVAASCAALVLLAACAKPEEKAAEAVQGASTALEAVREQAARYHPDQLATAVAGVASLEQKLADKDYEGVSAAAPAVMQGLEQLQDEAAAKQAELAKAMAAAKGQWDEYAAKVPPLIDAAQARVAMLQKSLTLPAGLDQDTFAKGAEALQAATSAWTAASEAYAAEDGAAALKSAGAAFASGQEAVKLLDAGSEQGAGR